MAHNVLAAAVVAVLLRTGRAFYLPGVAPVDYAQDDQIPVKTNSLRSIQTQLPYDYYSLAYCRPPGGPQQSSENLGELLTGDRIETTPYEVFMLKEEYCKTLCQVHLNNAQASDFKQAIASGYNVEWMVDGLPAASLVPSDAYITPSYSGFPVGYQDSAGTAFIYNHLHIILDYHEIGENAYRVVKVTVMPYSINHQIVTGQVYDSKTNPNPRLSTCDYDRHVSYDNIDQHARAKNGNIIFAYDVSFVASDVTWASRWDVYLTSNNAVPDKVHWFSIINSLLIVLFLTGMIAMILIRVLRRDISKYNRVPTDEEKAEEREETGWKLVHADVFRPPAQFPMLFSVCAGTGAQLAVMSVFLVFFAAIGFLTPANRGSIMIGLLLLYVLSGSVAGFVSARLYKTFKGKLWQRCTLLTAMGFPGIAFVVFLALDIMEASYGSTAAVPILSMIAVIALWFGVSVPLVFLGAFFGYKKDAIEFPVITSNIPRQIPVQPWYLSASVTCLVGGILPFGCVFVQLFFMLSSIWLDQSMYMFGFLLIVLLILMVTVAEITIVLTYFQLCAEDYHWWWRSFLSSGSTALYIFLYSCAYVSKLQASTTSAYVLYFGYSLVACFAVFLFTGSIGFSASFVFNQVVFSSIKVD